MNPKWNLLSALWGHRTKLLVLVLIASLIAPQPARRNSASTGPPSWQRSTARNRDIQYDGRRLQQNQRSIGDSERLMKQPTGVLCQYCVSPVPINRAQAWWALFKGVHAESGDLRVTRASAHPGQPASSLKALAVSEPMNVPRVRRIIDALSTVPVRRTPTADPRTD